jgi:Ca2+-binding EF-hand superfamily protein
MRSIEAIRSEASSMTELMRKTLPILLAALLFGSAPALGQSGEPPLALSPEEAWVISNAAGAAPRTGSLAELKLNLESRFRQADMDASGTITPRDAELRQSIASAGTRASRIHRWMQSDLDGDGKVSRDEIAGRHLQLTAGPMQIGGTMVAPTPAQRKEATDQYVAKEMAADADGDGVITFEEALRSANEVIAKQRVGSHYAREAVIPDSFDTNRDGTIEFSEFTAVVSRVLARLDTNNNGTFDADEVVALTALQKAAREVMNQERARERSRSTITMLEAACAIPKIPAGVTAIHLEADQGAALSNVSLGGDDKVVSVIDVVVENGAAPLYVSASSRGAVIWRVAGATQRIRRFVAASENTVSFGKGTRTGVSGLDARVVHLVTRPDCFSVPSGTPRRGDMSEQLEPFLFQTMLGRQPDLIVRAPEDRGMRTVARFELPTGTLHVKAAYAGARTLPTSGPSAVIWEDILRGRPGGVVDIDPATIVATAPPQAFEVMPGVAGLAQLVDQGVLEPVEFLPGWRHPDGRVDVGSLMKSKAGTPGAFEAPSAFRIVAPMRMPPGHLSVYGVSPKFILAPGVPMPANLQTGTCVFAEQTRDILSGRGRTNCR